MRSFGRLGSAGAASRGSLVAIALLVIALFGVLVLWMNDRESADAELDIDIGSVPALELLGAGSARA